MTDLSGKIEGCSPEQIAQYLDDAGHCFQLPLDMAGTAFQQRVWNELRRIPAGTVLTYGELAQRLGSGARAVGNACRANPLPVIVPCHRVVSRRSSGAYDLGGYSGSRNADWLSIKRGLLAHEGVLLD